MCEKEVGLMANLRKVTIKIDEDVYGVIEKMAKKNGENFSEQARILLGKSLNLEWFKDNEDQMASLIRSQMEIVIKPHIERLASLSAKTGHMASTATFLNVQAFMDLVVPEKKKDVKVLYENARKKAVEYMRTPTDEYSEK